MDDQNRNLLLATALSFLVILVWFVVFVVIFKRQFPLGWLDEQLKAVFGPLVALVGLG